MKLFRHPPEKFQKELDKLGANAPKSRRAQRMLELELESLLIAVGGIKPSEQRGIAERLAVDPAELTKRLLHILLQYHTSEDVEPGPWARNLTALQRIAHEGRNWTKEQILQVATEALE